MAQVGWIRFFQTGKPVAGYQRMELESNPQIVCPTKETHNLEGLRKQCIQWAIMIADGESGSPGPVPWAHPVEEGSWGAAHALLSSHQLLVH